MMGKQLEEVKEFREAMAEQEMKRKIRLEAGMTASMVDDQSNNSRSSSFNQSQLTGLRSTKNQNMLNSRHDGGSTYSKGNSQQAFDFRRVQSNLDMD